MPTKRKKAKYSRKAFLKYYGFKDEPESVPQIFHRAQNSYTDLIDNVKKDVEIGVKLIDAIALNAGVTQRIVNKWKKDYLTELEDGKTDTPLIRLFAAGMKSDAKLYRKVMSMAMGKAEEGDASTIQFLAKNRLGYGRPQNNFNIDNSENNSIQITISDMKSIESDEPIEVNATVEEPKKELPDKWGRTEYTGIEGTIYDKNMTFAWEEEEDD